MPPSQGLVNRDLKLVLVGSGGVGKSALTIRFTTSQFIDQGYNPTIEDSYRKQFVVDDEAVQLEILDTAGQEEYAAMADQWYKYGVGFMLVYSITDRPTFEAVRALHEHIKRVKDKNYVPCVLVSNKCDLGRLRQVGQQEGRELAKSLHMPLIECSAADGVNVEVAFRELVKLVRRDERRMSSSTARTNSSLTPTASTLSHRQSASTLPALGKQQSRSSGNRPVQQLQHQLSHPHLSVVDVTIRDRGNRQRTPSPLDLSKANGYQEGGRGGVESSKSGGRTVRGNEKGNGSRQTSSFPRCIVM